MSQTSLSDVHILIYEAGLAAANPLDRALAERGFKNTAVVGTIAEAREACSNQRFDLILCDNEQIASKRGSLCRTIRFGEIGENPYVVVFSMLQQAEHETVRQVIGDGVDNLLAKPLDPADLFDRVTSMIHGRKPFAITSNYIGPIRQGAQHERSELPPIEVPNTLRDKAINAYDFARISREIRQANARVNSCLIIDGVREISSIVTNVSLRWDRGMLVSPGPQMDQLATYISTVEQRLKNTPDEHVGALCTRMLAVIQDLRSNFHKAQTKDIRLLQNLAQDIYVSLGPDERVATLSKEIADTVIGANSGKGGQTQSALAMSPWRRH